MSTAKLLGLAVVGVWVWVATEFTRYLRAARGPR